jgi:phage-related protein
LVFAMVDKKSVVALAVHVFQKKTQKTKQSDIVLAEKRLRDWCQRGNSA